MLCRLYVGISTVCGVLCRCVYTGSTACVVFSVYGKYRLYCVFCIREVLPVMCSVVCIWKVPSVMYCVNVCIREVPPVMCCVVVFIREVPPVVYCFLYTGSTACLVLCFLYTGSTACVVMCFLYTGSTACNVLCFLYTGNTACVMLCILYTGSTARNVLCFLYTGNTACVVFSVYGKYLPPVLCWFLYTGSTACECCVFCIPEVPPFFLFLFLSFCVCLFSVYEKYRLYCAVFSVYGKYRPYCVFCIQEVLHITCSTSRIQKTQHRRLCFLYTGSTACVVMCFLYTGSTACDVMVLFLSPRTCWRTTRSSWTGCSGTPSCRILFGSVVAFPSRCPPFCFPGCHC